MDIEQVIAGVLQWSYPYEGVFKDGILATVNHLRSTYEQENPNPEN
jgi:hypothetical protein